MKLNEKICIKKTKHTHTVYIIIAIDYWFDIIRRLSKIWSQQRKSDWSKNIRISNSKFISLSIDFNLLAFQASQKG